MGQAPDPLKFHVDRTLFRKAYGVLANEHLMHPIDQGDWPVRIDGRRQLFTEDDADSPELLMQTRKHKAGTIVVLPRRTTTDRGNPGVSTGMCRFGPLIFLPGS